MGKNKLESYIVQTRYLSFRKLTNSSRCVKSSIFRPDSAVTRLVPNSGKSSPTSTVLTPPVHIMVTQIFSWRESTSTTMRQPVENMFPVPSLSILSQVPWTPSAPAHSDRSSDPTTSFSDRVVLETTGPRVTTQRALSSSTQSLMLSAKRQRAVIVFRDSN